MRRTYENELFRIMVEYPTACHKLVQADLEGFTTDFKKPKSPDQHGHLAESVMDFLTNLSREIEKYGPNDQRTEAKKAAVIRVRELWKAHDADWNKAWERKRMEDGNAPQPMTFDSNMDDESLENVSTCDLSTQAPPSPNRGGQKQRLMEEGGKSGDSKSTTSASSTVSTRGTHKRKWDDAVGQHDQNKLSEDFYTTLLHVLNNYRTSFAAANKILRSVGGYAVPTGTGNEPEIMSAIRALNMAHAGSALDQTASHLINLLEGQLGIQTAQEPVKTNKEEEQYYRVGFYKFIGKAHGSGIPPSDEAKEVLFKEFLDMCKDAQPNWNLKQDLRDDKEDEQDDDAERGDDENDNDGGDKAVVDGDTLEPMSTADPYNDMEDGDDGYGDSDGN